MESPFLSLHCDQIWEPKSLDKEVKDDLFVASFKVSTLIGVVKIFGTSTRLQSEIFQQSLHQQKMAASATVTILDLWKVAKRGWL